MNGTTENIKLRHAAHCYLADKDYGERLAKGMMLDMNTVMRLAGMTHKERMRATALV